MTSTNNHNNSSFNKVFILITIGIVLVFSLVSFALLMQINEIRGHANFSDSRLSYRLDRLNFCYQYQLTPCSDDKIEVWNAENPDQQFVINNAL